MRFGQPCPSISVVAVAFDNAQHRVRPARWTRSRPLDDPLAFISVLYGFWTANLFGFNGKNLIEISQRIMALSEGQGTTFARMMGHRTLGVALMGTGAFTEARRHLDQAVTFYSPTEHRQFATRFLHAQVANLSQRAMVLWELGFPDATLSDLEHLLKEGRDIDHAASLMGALFYASLLDVWCKGHAADRKLTEKLLILAD